MRNVNNASYNAIEELKRDSALKSIALNSYFPLHEIKEVYRIVGDVERVSKIVKVCEEYNYEPTNIANIVNVFNYKEFSEFKEIPEFKGIMDKLNDL